MNPLGATFAGEGFWSHDSRWLVAVGCNSPTTPNHDGRLGALPHGPCAMGHCARRCRAGRTFIFIVFKCGSFPSHVLHGTCAMGHCAMEHLGWCRLAPEQDTTVASLPPGKATTAQGTTAQGSSCHDTSMATGQGTTATWLAPA